MEENKKSSGIALLPLGLFLVVYFTTGLVLQSQGVEMAFYQLPSPVVVLLGVILAIFIFKGKTIDKINVFLHGCGSEDVMTMCMIFLLAGAFSAVAGAMGGVESVVNLGMSFIPPRFVAAGVFIISALISTATGTSCGTISAVVPIAIGLATASGCNQFLVVGAAIGGSMFGDNLSMISDTTITATRSQGVEMKDKFKANFWIALPAAIITIILLLIFGAPETIVAATTYEYSIVKVLPYLFVLVAALAGVNVFVVLTGGIVFSGIVGIATKSFTVLEFANHTYSGFTGMIETFLLCMFVGGLAAMVAHEGGINWIIEKVKKLIKGRRSAELGISLIVSLTDIATANNTVAIMIDGPIAKNISEEFNVDPKRSASLLDVFSCVFQGLIPYGAQFLIATGLMANVNNPMELVSKCWYSFVLMAVAIVSIIITKDRKKVEK